MLLGLASTVGLLFFQEALQTDADLEAVKKGVFKGISSACNTKMIFNFSLLCSFFTTYCLMLGKLLTLLPLLYKNAAGVLQGSWMAVSFLHQTDYFIETQLI